MSVSPPIEFQARFKAPFATLGICTSESALIRIAFLPVNTPALPPVRNSIAHLVCAQLTRYIETGDTIFDIPIRLQGTKHELDVWAAMQRIAPGKTLTYGALAAAIGSSARAVGTACGRNPVPVIVPCHRIVAASGLGGFMGGKRDDSLSIKRWLLNHEIAVTGRHPQPLVLQ